jgi:peptide/nickel transport system permease protein
VVRYLIRRIVLEAIPILLLITILGFIGVRATGDPLAVYMRGGGLDAEGIAVLRAKLGLDKPVPVQYFYWLAAILQGDWGISFVTREPVFELIMQRLPNTLILMSAVYLMTIFLAVPLGIFAATKRRSFLANLLDTLAFLAFSTPTFWLGIMLIIVFSVKFRQWGLPALPIGGMYDPNEGPSVGSVLLHLILPTTVLAIVGVARYARYLRATVLEEMTQDYVRTARAKGLTERIVLGRHIIRNSLIPLVALVTLDIPLFLSWAVVTEQVFSWPGTGRLLVEHAERGDQPTIMGILVISGILVITFSIVADVLYTYLNPKIRLS